MVLACDSWFQPIVIDTDGNPLSRGRSSRSFSTAQSNALILRDGGWVFSDCDAPASWCDAHHIVASICGGKTDLINGALLCRSHHGLAHSNDPWTLGAIVADTPYDDTAAADHRPAPPPGPAPPLRSTRRTGAG